MDETPILPDEALSPEDLEQRRKGLALVARIEYLYQTNEGFRRWYHEGIEQIEHGEYVTLCQECLSLGNPRHLDDAVNNCDVCDKALCQDHSHPTISDNGYDVFACPACFFSS